LLRTGKKGGGKKPVSYCERRYFFPGQGGKKKKKREVDLPSLLLVGKKKGKKGRDWSPVDVW